MIMNKKILFPLALILSTAIFACGEQQATTSTLGTTPIDPSVTTTTTTQPTKTKLKKAKKLHSLSLL